MRYERGRNRSTTQNTDREIIIIIITYYTNTESSASQQSSSAVFGNNIDYKNYIIERECVGSISQWMLKWWYEKLQRICIP